MMSVIEMGFFNDRSATPEMKSSSSSSFKLFSSLNKKKQQCSQELYISHCHFPLGCSHCPLCSGRKCQQVFTSLGRGGITCSWLWLIE